MTDPRERAEEAQRLLIEAGRVLASSLDYDQTVRDALGLFIPRLADWCMIFVRERDDTIRVASVAHSNLALGEAAQRFLEHYHSHINEPRGIAEIIRTGKSAFVPQGDPAVVEAIRAAFPDEGEQLVGDGMLGWMLVPLESRERTLGAIGFISSSHTRQYEPSDLELAEELGRRAGAAIDNARLYEAARAAVSARDEVLGIVAHDLRNPVGTIQMTAELLLDESIAVDDRMRYYGIIRRATDRMKHLIQDLLDVTSIDAGSLTVDTKRTEVSTLLDEVREMFAGQVSEKLQRLEFDFPADMPAVLVDNERMLQVFSNLVGNAVKFTPEGGRITVNARRDGHATRFAVRDTGAGIAANEIEHVFDRFWQSRRARRGGAGLGLAIAKGIVEAHGGTIGVTSVAGQGTEFRFILPDIAS